MAKADGEDITTNYTFKHNSHVFLFSVLVKKKKSILSVLFL